MYLLVIQGATAEEDQSKTEASPSNSWWNRDSQQSK